MDIKKGYLLVTDISGYTQFLVESELGHAKEILDSLLKSTMDRIKAPVRILNTRGDAVLCFVDENQFIQPQSLIEAIERIYYDFRNQLSFMDLNTTCPCNACININTLDLKVFLHFGEYIEQDLDGATELQGADVILVNLLMKNTVKEALGLYGYALISDAAIEAMGAEDLVGDMFEHAETYEHFDEVRMRIWDLPAEWQREVARHRSDFSAENAWVAVEREIAAPQWTVWDYATDRDTKRRYLGMEAVHRTDDLGGAIREGSAFHCVHREFDVHYTITDWDPPNRYISSNSISGLAVEFALQLTPTEKGASVQMLYGQPSDNDDDLRQLLIESGEDSLERLAAIIDEALAKA